MPVEDVEAVNHHLHCLLLQVGAASQGSTAVNARLIKTSLFLVRASRAVRVASQ